MKNLDAKAMQETLDHLNEVIAEKKRTRGEDHDETFAAMRKLAMTLLDMDRNTDAISVLQDLHLKQKKALGTKHPDSKDTEQLLALLHSCRR